MRNKTPDDILRIKDVQTDYNLSPGTAKRCFIEAKTKLNKPPRSLITRRDFEAALELNITADK